MRSAGGSDGLRPAMGELFFPGPRNRGSRRQAFACSLVICWPVVGRCSGWAAGDGAGPPSSPAQRSVRAPASNNRTALSASNTSSRISCFPVCHRRRHDVVEILMRPLDHAAVSFIPRANFRRARSTRRAAVALVKKRCRPNAARRLQSGPCLYGGPSGTLRCKLTLQIWRAGCAFDDRADSVVRVHPNCRNKPGSVRGLGSADSEGAASRAFRNRHCFCVLRPSVYLVLRSSAIINIEPACRASCLPKLPRNIRKIPGRRPSSRTYPRNEKASGVFITRVKVISACRSSGSSPAFFLLKATSSSARARTKRSYRWSTTLRL